MEISSLTNAYAINRPAARADNAAVSEVAATEAASARDIQSRDRESEQNEIVDSLQTNARSLQAAGERIGTIIDVQA